MHLNKFSSALQTVNTLALTLFSQAQIDMIAVTGQSDEAQLSADNPISYNTRLAGFALNQSKQSKYLRQDADFETVVNNFNENGNMKCNSGFYLEVASTHNLTKHLRYP